MITLEQEKRLDSLFNRLNCLSNIDEENISLERLDLFLDIVEEFVTKIENELK